MDLPYWALFFKPEFINSGTNQSMKVIKKYKNSAKDISKIMQIRPKKKSVT